MNTCFLALALTVGQVQPPRGGDRPIEYHRQPQPVIDGNWTIVAMEVGGRPVVLNQDPVAVVRHSVITFAQGGQPQTIRLELAPRNRLLASVPSANDVRPDSPVRKNPHADGDDRGIVGVDRDSSRSGNRAADRTPNDDRGDREAARARRPASAPPYGDPNSPDVGGVSGRASPPHSEDFGTGEGSRANQVTERDVYNTGAYVLAGDYLTVAIKLPLQGTVEYMGQRDRRPPSHGGNVATAGDRDTRPAIGPQVTDVGPDVKVNQELVLILKKRRSE